MPPPTCQASTCIPYHLGISGLPTHLRSSSHSPLSPLCFTSSFHTSPGRLCPTSPASRPRRDVPCARHLPRSGHPLFFPHPAPASLLPVVPLTQTAAPSSSWVRGLKGPRLVVPCRGALIPPSSFHFRGRPTPAVACSRAHAYRNWQQAADFYFRPFIRGTALPSVPSDRLAGRVLPPLRSWCLAPALVCRHAVATARALPASDLERRRAAVAGSAS